MLLLSVTLSFGNSLYHGLLSLDFSLLSVHSFHCNVVEDKVKYTKYNCLELLSINGN